MAKRTGKAMERAVKKIRTKGSKRAATVSLPSTGKMSRVLTFGKRSHPTSIIVMFHGLNDSAACCSKGVARKWIKGLPGSLIVVPQSPDQSIWSDSKDPGYDWLRQQGTHNTNDDEANVRELQRVTRLRMRHTESWLRALLVKYGVRKDRLILTGFSQGSILAALCAARMGALGAVPCGGVTGQPVYSAKVDDYVGGGWMRWEELLPRSKCQTRFCCVNGTLDGYVPRKCLEKMLQPFDCHWHWDKGVGHDFPDSWYDVCLRWMQDLLGYRS